jgi:hypothetical protein
MYMKQKLLVLITVTMIAVAVTAQKNKKNGFVPGQKKPALFGFALHLLILMPRKILAGIVMPLL